MLPATAAQARAESALPGGGALTAVSFLGSARKLTKASRAGMDSGNGQSPG